MCRAVVGYGLHGVRGPGGLHDGLVPASVVKLDADAAGRYVLPDIVAGIENAAGAVRLIAPGGGPVRVGGDDLGVAVSEGDDSHGGGERDLDGGRVGGATGRRAPDKCIRC